MKKLILSLALCCAATNFFAQNADPAQLVNEGKAMVVFITIEQPKLIRNIRV